MTMPGGEMITAKNAAAVIGQSTRLLLLYNVSLRNHWRLRFQAAMSSMIRYAW
jgi:hypothetical protein